MLAGRLSTMINLEGAGGAPRNTEQVKDGRVVRYSALGVSRYP
jgi:hypothetical protein